MKAKREMPVGQKVRGYGILNEYGEFDFIPEQTGSRKGQVRFVKETDTYTISVTKNKILIHLKMDKANGLALVVAFASIMDDILQTLKSYEF